MSRFLSFTVYMFLTGGAYAGLADNGRSKNGLENYAHYATCMATPPVSTGIGDLLRVLVAFSLMWYITLAISLS